MASKGDLILKPFNACIMAFFFILQKSDISIKIGPIELLYLILIIFLKKGSVSTKFYERIPTGYILLN